MKTFIFLSLVFLYQVGSAECTTYRAFLPEVHHCVETISVCVSNGKAKLNNTLFTFDNCRRVYELGEYCGYTGSDAQVSFEGKDQICTNADTMWVLGTFEGKDRVYCFYNPVTGSNPVKCR